MTTYTRHKVKGITKLRRTINRFEKEEKDELQKIIKQGAKAIKRDAIFIATAKDIKLTGAMIGSIDYKLSNDKMTAVIGPGAASARVRKNPFDTVSLTKGLKSANVIIKHKDAQWNLMKAWWAEFGTGAPIPQDPQPFMNPAYEMNKRSILNKTKRSLRVALRRVSRGGN